MPEQSRRDFLKQVGTAAVSAAVGPLPIGEGRRSAYAAAVQEEASLRAYWPLDGSLKSLRGPSEAAMRGGEAVYAEAPLGGRALQLEANRYAVVGDAGFLDTEEATVELFFRLTAPPSPAYNPCLLAKRASSPHTRFSLHVMNDLTQLAIWNGQLVVQFAVPDGLLRVGQWYHLTVTSGAEGQALYLDGVACRSAGSAPFNLAERGHPLVLGASAADGAERADCMLSDVAIYAAVLPAARITRHLEAAGWAERQRALARERDRREAERQRQRAAKREQRRRDPRLTARGEPRVYAGDHLGAIAFGLGGIGAGSIQMNGRAERAIWQIFNNFAGGPLPNSFFAVRARRGEQPAVVRALQTSRVGPFQAMAALRFRGEYPFAWYDFDDPALPARVHLEAYSPFIPLRERESAIPCAIFNLTAENPTNETLEVAFLAAQQNAVGYDGSGPILDRRFGGYGGNRAAVAMEEGATVLHLTSDRPATDQNAGDMALAVAEASAVGTAAWTALPALLAAFTEQGRVEGPQEASPTPAGQTLDGALTVPFRLKPGEKRTVRFVLAWHFPNARHGDAGSGWKHEGNRYAGWWPNAHAVARYVLGAAHELESETRLYHDTLYRSNLPHWLLDRITSQTAILRSKTCFWSADDYFGAWEGCAPGGGCCFGSCTHVWHYAQAHARLFPGLARRMRAATLGFQRPDGGLPHRHPGLPTALDGQCGDILGAYREHLSSPDGQWLATWWPRVKRAMEHTIAHWDPNEDGVLSGAQWNTLDGDLGGSTTWIGSLYLSALSACERMASLRGDPTFAARCRRIRDAGAKKQDQTLWNGEYYIQLRDPEPHQDYGTGCEIDQLLGEWWAAQIGLQPHYPAERQRSALGALLKYNFQPDFQGVPQAPRKFVDDNDAGMQMIKWPKGPRPNPTILYGDEVMSGFEYSAAAAMIQNGMLREGLMVALAISDRYDGRLRTGLTPVDTASWGYSGNPFGDDECGKYYARAMSVWSLLLACQGFLYDGPAGRIGFTPVWRPDNHASFFTAAEGWGLFTQRRSGGRQRARIELTRGRLRVREIVLAAPSGMAPADVHVRHAGQRLPAHHIVTDGKIIITLDVDATLTAGQTLDVEV